MGFFKRKLSTQELLLQECDRLASTHSLICPDVIDNMRNAIRNNSIKYSEGTVAYHFPQLVFKYGWEALSKTASKWYDNYRIPHFVRIDDYHEGDGRLNSKGMQLLLLVIEYSGKALEMRSISKNEFDDIISDFCYHSNMFNIEKYT